MLGRGEGVLTLLTPGQGLSLGISCRHQGLLMESICILYQQDFAVYQHFWSHGVSAAF